MADKALGCGADGRSAARRSGISGFRSRHRSSSSTLEATRAGRRDHAGASADLAAVATEIAEQVRLLDGLVRYRFGDNAELMGAWSSARNVLGPFRSRSEPDAGDGQTPSEAGPDAVKPAA